MTPDQRTISRHIENRLMQLKFVAVLNDLVVADEIETVLQHLRKVR